MTKNLLKNTSVKLIRNIVLMVQAILLAPLVLKVFGLHLAGAWLLITQFSAYVQLVEFGIPSGLTRLYSHFKALKDLKSVNEVAGVSFGLLAFLSVFLLVFFGQLVELFFFIFDTIERHKAIEYAVTFGIIATSMSLPFRCGLGLLEANHLFYVHLWVEIFFVLFRLITFYVLYMIGSLDLKVFATVYFTVIFSIPFMQFIYSVKTGLIVFSLKTFSFVSVHISKIFSIGIAVAVTTASVTSLRQGSPMLLGVLDGAATTALFTIVMLVVVTFMQFLTIAVSFIGPQASELNALGESHKLYKLFLDHSKYSIIFASNIFLFFFFYGENLLSIWLGLEQQNILLMYDAIIILLATVSLSLPALYARSILSYIDKHKVTAASEFIVVFVGLTIGALLVYWFELGIAGMSYGVALVFMLRGFGPILFVFSRRFKVLIVRYLLDVYGENLIPLFFVGIMVFFVLQYVEDEASSLVYFCQSIFSFLTLITLQWFFVVSVSHKLYLKKAILRYLNRI